MKQIWKRLVYFTAASLIALTASAQAADIPQELRGSWCRTAITTDHGATHHIFKRAERCPRGEIFHTYISNGRISKGQGNTADACVAETVEKTVPPGDGWTIVFDCGFARIEQAMWPMKGGRLGMVTVGLEGKD
jgi:opacity protein-like surface antigen